MLQSFASKKEQVLRRADKSKKGDVDPPIFALVGAINSSPSFVTTSSCSGRTVVFAAAHQRDSGSGTTDVVTKRGRWCYVTHDSASSGDLVRWEVEVTILPLLEQMASLASYLGNPDFYGSLKFEPMILHIQCRTIEDAQSMLSAALASGFRNSGLIVGRKRRIMLAVRSTHGLEVPIVDKGKLLVSQEYVDYIVDHANNRMTENKRRIERLHSNVCSTLDAVAAKCCGQVPRVGGPIPCDTSHSSRDQLTVGTHLASTQSSIITTSNCTTDSESGEAGDSSSDDELILPWEQT